ncbi:MAG TPA: hypothetical protein VFU07_09710 [Candidatus Lumbricidophila sp.]|nr:hypothetical protein [Candidatus Lumbricidophila sp.]
MTRRIHRGDGAMRVDVWLDLVDYKAWYDVAKQRGTTVARLLADQARRSVDPGNRLAHRHEVEPIASMYARCCTIAEIAAAHNLTRSQVNYRIQRDQLKRGAA